MTSRLLYLTKKARPYLEPLVSFMSTEVSKSDEDYWKNLKKGLMWVNNTLEKKRVIGEISLSEVLTWVDASYAVN